ncbi:MAG: sugar phosphate isomerase/epimerase [Candidatus Eremiobacteraeota bacterium]|nr:sugar phosphate isomerase/epimerase [Candidatus Eremiobacteraeota bacterium]
MKIGYMPSIYSEDILPEIAFAKKHFDYIEITFKRDLSIYSKKYISSMNDILRGFKVMGHVHWGYDFSQGKPQNIYKAQKTIGMYKKIGARKSTVHPSAGNGGSIERIRTNNIKSLGEIAGFCEENGVQMLVENLQTFPYNRAVNLKDLIEKIPSIMITLDVGHANITSDSEFVNFLNIIGDKIGHIHLHDNIGEYDHLFFQDTKKLAKIIKLIKKSGYNDTITIESFRIMGKEKPIELGDEERKDLIIRQLGEIRDLL